MISDLVMATRAKRAGARYSLRIIREARGAGLPISFGFALVEQESGFSNVFGHDPTIFVGAGKVTKAKYLAYKKARGQTRMQGVGPVQLTWWATQDEADRLGGCWRPGINMRVGFQTLAANIKAHGEHDGAKAYNGTGPAAEKYADLLLGRKRKWHSILTGGK